LTLVPARASIEHVYALQASLFGSVEPGVDPGLGGLSRLELDEWCWIDHLQGWLAGSDEVFEALRSGLGWHQRRVVMYDRLVDEPRLVWWRSTSEPDAEPLPVLTQARHALAERYDRVFDSIGVNYYRDGSDSVAWHGDRNRFWSDDTVIAIISVGQPRPFLLRPRGGGQSRKFELGHGDLLVMVGGCQDRWEHCVPKVAHAGPRISITFREGAPDPTPGIPLPRYARQYAKLTA